MYTNRLNYKKLEDDILNYLRQVTKNFQREYNIRDLVDDTVYVYNNDTDILNNKLAELNKSIEKEKNIISNLYSDKVDGVISIETYKDLSKEHEDALIGYKKSKSEIEKKINAIENQSEGKEFYSCRKSVEEFLSLEQPTKENINKLIKKILLYDNEDGKEVKVLFNFKSLNAIATKM